MGVITNLSLGGVGTVNYVTDSGVESGVSQWSLYNDGASAAPVDGTGGSAAQLSLTATSSNPLRDKQSISLAKASGSAQGQGISTDFTIDLADQAKVLTVSFDYEILSGTYATGDLTVYLIQDPTGTPTVVQPAGYQVQSVVAGIASKHIATFQTSVTGTSYRLCIHAASTSTSTYALLIDNVIVGPQTVQYGAPVTDWVSFTPTGSWTTNTTYTGRWRRIGDSMQMTATAALTGAPNAVGIKFNLPSGFSIDTSKLANTDVTSGSRQILGSATVLDAGLSVRTGSVVFDTSTTLWPYSADATGDFSISNTNPITFGNGDAVSIVATFPILGWSSSVQMSNDTDTRVVAARYYASGNRTPSTTKAINYDTLVYDTHAAVTTVSGDVAGWKYTVPVAGYYRVTVNNYSSTAAVATLNVYKNGVFTATWLCSGNIANVLQTGSNTILCVAGDYLDVRTDAATTCNNVTSQVLTVDIERLSGPSAIAASETVAAAYWASANGAATSATPFNFDSREYDTHGAVTTGASWRFTAPISGLYNLGFCANASATSTSHFYVYKNGTIYKYIGWATTADIAKGYGTLRLNAGDYIDIRASGTFSYQGGALSSATANVFITRVGN